MDSSEKLRVDVEAVLKSKNPKLLKRMPRFLLKYLKRIVHEKDLNDFLEIHGDKKGLDFVDAILEDFNLSIETIGLNRVPQNGRYIFAANHPLGGLESAAFTKEVTSKFEHIKFPVNDILMALKPMHNILIPINKHGGQSKNSAKILEDEYAGNKQILYYPAGLVSRKIKREIRDLEWKKSFVNKAIKHKRDIVVVYIEGRNSSFFYNLANLRKFLGIKANLEMLYLVNEVYKQRNKTIRLVFSEPIKYETLLATHSTKEWADKLYEKCYKIASELPSI